MTNEVPQRNKEVAPQVVQDKHVQKQIDRLNRAREEKERKKGFTERGAPLPTDKLVKDTS